jgi:hypothetical protein
MKICNATAKDVLNIDPTLSAFDVEDILTLGDPNDTILDTIHKFNGCGGECGA